MRNRFYEGGPFCPPPHTWAAPKKPILNRVNGWSLFPSICTFCLCYDIYFRLSPQAVCQRLEELHFRDVDFSNVPSADKSLKDETRLLLPWDGSLVTLLTFVFIHLSIYLFIYISVLKSFNKASHKKMVWKDNLFSKNISLSLQKLWINFIRTKLKKGKYS